MKKLSVLMAAVMLLVSIISVLPVSASESWSEAEANYDDYGYYAYFDFENFGNASHHLRYMRGAYYTDSVTAVNADGKACDPFDYLSNTSGNASGTGSLKTEENGNKYLSYKQNSTNTNYDAIAVFTIQSSANDANNIIGDAAELSFRFRMQENQDMAESETMPLVHVRRGDKASNTAYVKVDIYGNIYAYINHVYKLVYTNPGDGKFMDISFKWYDASNTYSLYINGKPVVEAIPMDVDYRTETYVEKAFDDEFFVASKAIVGDIRAIELCRGVTTATFAFDIDDIMLKRLETKQHAPLYYENSFDASYADGVSSKITRSNSYRFENTSDDALKLNSDENGNKYISMGSGARFTIKDSQYHTFFNNSFVVEASVKAQPTHTSGLKSLFAATSAINWLGMIYVDPDGNLYLDGTETGLIGGYKLDGSEWLDFTIVATKSSDNKGKFGSFMNGATSSNNTYYSMSYYINGEYVGSTKDATLYEWKYDASTLVGTTVSNQIITIEHHDTTVDVSGLTLVADTVNKYANNKIYKSSDGKVFYEVEFDGDGNQVKYSTMTVGGYDDSITELGFFAGKAFKGDIDNVKVYEGTSPDWFYENVNSKKGGEIINANFGAIAALNSEAKAQTSTGTGEKIYGTFRSSGFTASRLSRKTANGTAVTKDNIKDAEYATVTFNNGQASTNGSGNWWDFFIPVPNAVDGVYEVNYSFETTVKNINITPGTSSMSGQFHFFRQRIENDSKSYSSGDLFCVDSNMKLWGGDFSSSDTGDKRFALCDKNGNQIVLDNSVWNTIRADVYILKGAETGSYNVSYYLNGELLYLSDGSAAYRVVHSSTTWIFASYFGSPNHRVRYSQMIHGDAATIDIKSIKIGTKSIEKADYTEVSQKPFDVDGRVSVIELDIPDYVNNDNSGYYAVLEMRKSENNFGVIYADAKSGQLAIFNNGVYDELYSKDGEPLTLGEEPVSVAVVFDDILYRSRYYVNGALAYVEDGDGYKALVDVSIAAPSFIYDTRDTSFWLFSGFGEDLDISRYNLNVYGINDGDTAEVIGYQESSVENGIRIVAGVDTLYYSNVGFEVERYENGVFVGSTEVMDDIVYSSIVADKTEISAEKEGHKYLATLNITNLPLMIPDNTTLVIRAFTEIEGVKKYDFKAEIAVSNDGYEFVESDDTKVYTKKQAVLLVGQSNMAGRGKLDTVEAISDPRIKLLRNNEWIQMVEPIHTDKTSAGVGLAASFAKAFVEKFDVELALLPAAVGGTSIGQWTKGYSGSTDLDLYENAIAMGKKAQEDGYEICAILWHQGCSNEGTSKYDEKMKVVFDDFITDLELDPEKIVLITGELGEFRPSGSANVSESIAKLAPHYKNYGVATSESLLAIDVTTHFDGPSLRVFGYRYFEIFYKLVTGKKFEFVDDVEYYRVDPADAPQPDDGDNDTNYVANVNFNNLTAGTTYTTTTEIGNIQIFPNSKSVQVFAKADNANDKYIGLNAQKDKTPPYVDIVTNYAVGSVIVTEVKFMMSDGYDVSAPAIKLVQSNPVASIHLLRVGKDGKLYNAVNGTSTTAALVNPANNQTFTLDKFEWTTIKIVADLANNTKDIYVDGVLCGEGLGLCSSASTAASFKVDLTRIMQFDQSNGEGGTMYVDDFKSYNGNESQASNVISCDFDSFEAGTITSTNKDKGVAYFSVGSTVSMAIVEDGSNKYASTSSITTANGNGYFDVITPATPGNDITIEAKFKLGKYNENSPAICGDLIKLLDPSATTIALVRLDADGTLRDFVYSGTGKYPANGDSLGVKLSETEWTTIKVVCHMNENTKDIYINGNLVVKDSALYNTNGAASYETAKTRVMHYKSSGIGTLYVDDFTFTK